MYLIIATLPEGGEYFYGPYVMRSEANAVIEKAEERKGDRAPVMRVVALQPSDSFLVGSARRTYTPGVWWRGEPALAAGHSCLDTVDPH